MLGGALADPTRRPVRLIGDGAAQLTVAELGSLIRERFPAIVLVVNNAGYTVERAIHGRDEHYNDIAPWQWSILPSVLGAAEHAIGVRARTSRELSEALATARAETRLTLIEAVLDHYDVPPLLVAVAEAAAAANAPTHDG